MAARGLWAVLLGVGLVLGGCMQSTIEPASDASMTVRDKKLLAAAPYQKAAIPEPYQRHIVEYTRKEAPGTILIDSDNKFLYYVLPDGKAIRYGVTVGEEALAWSGVAKVQRKAGPSDKGGLAGRSVRSASLGRRKPCSCLNLPKPPPPLHANLC